MSVPNGMGQRILASTVLSSLKHGFRCFNPYPGVWWLCHCLLLVFCLLTTILHVMVVAGVQAGVFQLPAAADGQLPARLRQEGQPRPLWPRQQALLRRL